MSARPHRILIVDDSPLVLEVARASLEEAGFQVDAALTLSELEAMHTVEGLDLILMDVEMPELFGDDVASVLRHKRGVTAPIYLYSNLDSAQLAERAADAMIEGYISKGEGVEALVSRVKSILNVEDDHDGK